MLNLLLSLSDAAFYHSWGKDKIYVRKIEIEERSCQHHPFILQSFSRYKSGKHASIYMNMTLDTFIHPFIQLFLNSLGIVHLLATVRSIPELKGQPVSLHGLAVAVLIDIKTLDPPLKMRYLLMNPGTLSHHGQVLG